MVSSPSRHAVLGVLVGPLLLLGPATGGGSSTAVPAVVGAAAGRAGADSAAAERAAVAPGVVSQDLPRAGPRWRWPLTPRPVVQRRFVAPLGAYGPGHRGVDLGATPGSAVLAVEGGVVTHAGPVAGRGTVTVRHAHGLSSTYEPVSPEVAVGDRVSVGDVVGVLAATGADAGGAGHCGVSVCLHLGARRGATYLDPLLLLLSGRVRLLPLRGGQTTG